MGNYETGFEKSGSNDQTDNSVLSNTAMPFKPQEEKIFGPGKETNLLSDALDTRDTKVGGTRLLDEFHSSGLSNKARPDERAGEFVSKHFGSLGLKDGTNSEGGLRDFGDTGFRTGGRFGDERYPDTTKSELAKSEAEFKLKPPDANLNFASLFDDAYKSQIPQKNEARKKIGSFQVSSGEPKRGGDSVEVPNHPEILGASIQPVPMKDGSIRLDVHWIDRNKLTSSKIPLTDFQKRYPEAVFFRDKYEQ